MSAEVRVLGVVCAVIVEVGVGAGVLGVADHLAAAALLGAALAWLLLGRLRQVLRIRRRVADTAGTRRAEHHTGTGPDSGVPQAATWPRGSTEQVPQCARQAGSVAGVPERTGGAT